MTAVTDVRQDVAALPGSQFPLGATVTETGTNFAVESGAADGMFLCLFDKAGAETRIPVTDRDAGVWHVFVPGVEPGQEYGYRATGPWDPAQGLRCNPAKLLLDPYARAVTGTVRFGPELFGHSVTDPGAPSDADSAASVPRSLVLADEPFRWRAGAHPARPYQDSIIYEVHVKGFTMRHPGVPPELRGTYAGLGHEAAVGHLADLGVTAVELLPVHENIPESFLVERGLTNYWGYNTIGYFTPHQGYSAAVRAGSPGGQVAEFKAMVDALHGAGIEVILDVVFNHTAEGNELGPTFCFRGLDNPAYYRLDPADPSRYVDTTGADDPDRAANGTWLVDDDFLVLVNAWWEPLKFTLPATRPEARWRVEVDTWDVASAVVPAQAGARQGGADPQAGECVRVGPRSVVVLLSPLMSRAH